MEVGSREGTRWAGSVAPWSVVGGAAGWVVRVTGSGRGGSGGWSVAGCGMGVVWRRWMVGDGRWGAGCPSAVGSAVVGSTRGWRVGLLRLPVVGVDLRCGGGSSFGEDDRGAAGWTVVGFAGGGEV
ncbi:MAG: hypothetical protein ACRDZO_16545 [Egibacteraceae bacterium]